MTNATSLPHADHIPLELTAPVIQRLARKGLSEPLSVDELHRLCECVVFHIDAALQQRRIPKALKRSR